jgi:hypothetical protein
MNIHTTFTKFTRSIEFSKHQHSSFLFEMIFLYYIIFSCCFTPRKSLYSFIEGWLKFMKILSPTIETVWMWHHSYHIISEHFHKFKNSICLWDILILIEQFSVGCRPFSTVHKYFIKKGKIIIILFDFLIKFKFFVKNIYKRFKLDFLFCETISLLSFWFNFFYTFFP